MGDLIVCACVEEGGKARSHTCTVLNYLESRESSSVKAGVWRMLGHSCGTLFFLHVHLYICRRTFAGPGRALRNRMELIAATRKKNDKTDPLPMIVIRGENDINEPGRAGRVFHAPVLTSSPVTAVQTVQGSGCFNALMTRAVSRGQIDGRRDSWELSDMSVLIW